MADRDSIGEIGLDLVVNQNQFKRQMNSMMGMAKKAGAALASAFAVGKLVEFGKKCLELGSDLAEVQNVVDVTFPTLSAQVVHRYVWCHGEGIWIYRKTGFRYGNNPDRIDR